MVIKYDVTIQPVKLTCSACRRGFVYVVAYDRKSSAEYVSHPQPCSRDSEVTYGRITDDIIVPSFQLNFESQKDKKLVNFSIYDFSKRPKIDRVAEFQVPLGDYVNAFASESFCAVRDFEFKDGRVKGSLRVLLRMFPSGTEMPTMAPKQPTAVLKDDVIVVLRREKLIPSGVDVTALEGDADVLEELAAKVVMLERTSAMKKVMTPAALDLFKKRTELEALLDELEAADRLDGGRSQLDAADRNMLAAIEGEEAVWLKRIDALSSSFSPECGSSGKVKDEALVKELLQQRAAIERQLKQLEDMQFRRDVTKEAIELLEGLRCLNEVIKDANGGESPTTTSAPSQLSTRSTNTKKSIKFKEDDDAPESLARRLLHAHALVEAAEYSTRLLDTLKHKPYDGVADALETHEKQPVPSVLAGVLRNNRKGPASTSGAPVETTRTGATASTSGSSATTKVLLDDLFSGGPSVALQQPISGSTAATEVKKSVSPQRAAIELDALFGVGPTAPPSVMQRSDAPSQSPPQPAAAQSAQSVRGEPSQSVSGTPAAALPKFEVLSIPTTTIPVNLDTTKSVKVRSHAVRFVDHTGTRFVRGSEVVLENTGNAPLAFAEFSVSQEDIFSGSETKINSRTNTSIVRVVGGSKASVFLSYSPPDLSMNNAMMVLLRVLVKFDDGREVRDSVRLTL